MHDILSEFTGSWKTPWVILRLVVGINVHVAPVPYDKVVPQNPPVIDGRARRGTSVAGPAPGKPGSAPCQFFGHVCRSWGAEQCALAMRHCQSQVAKSDPAAKPTSPASQEECTSLQGTIETPEAPHQRRRRLMAAFDPSPTLIAAHQRRVIKHRQPRRVESRFCSQSMVLSR